MKRRTVLQAGASAVLIGAASSGLAQNLVDQDAYKIVLMRLNEIRPPLKFQISLMDMSLQQSRSMQQMDQTIHYDAIGRTPTDRAVLAGYEGQILGETLAQTFEGPSQTLDTWLNNNTTRDVLLDPNATDLGLGLTINTDGRHWWSATTGRS